MPQYWNDKDVKFITIGFELEFDSSFRNVKGEVKKLLKKEYGKDKVQEYDGYVNSDGTAWDIKRDISAGSGNSMGWEIASPKFRIDEIEKYKEGIRIVNSFTEDTQIWHGCGLHVHLGLGNLDRDCAKNFILMMIFFKKQYSLLCQHLEKIMIMPEKIIILMQKRIFKNTWKI